MASEKAPSLPSPPRPFPSAVHRSVPPRSQLTVQPLIHHLDTLHNQHQQPLTLLALAAYAADAMRVLTRLEQQAAMSPALDSALRGACADWRNPGAVHDAAELIPPVLQQVGESLRTMFADLSVVTSLLQRELAEA